MLSLDRAGDFSGEEADLITDLTTEDTHFDDNIDTNDETLETGDKSTSISDASTTEATDGVTTLRPQGAGSDGQASSCANNVCRNGGTCLTSIDGFQCHCRYNTELHNAVCSVQYGVSEAI